MVQLESFYSIMTYIGVGKFVDIYTLITRLRTLGSWTYALFEDTSMHVLRVSHEEKHARFLVNFLSAGIKTDKNCECILYAMKIYDIDTESHSHILSKICKKISISFSYDL